MVTGRVTLVRLCAWAVVLVLVFAPTAALADSPEAPPERIVSLEYTETEMLLTLGVTPVGVADREGYRKWVDILSERLEGAADVGLRQEPSFEEMMELEPDLILAPAFRHRAIRERLQEIAPTVLVESVPDDPQSSYYRRMKEVFREIAALVDRTPAAEAALEDLEAALTAERKRLAGAGLSGTRVAFLYPVPGSNRFRLFTPNSLVMGTAERLGLEPAAVGEGESFGFRLVGIEALAELGGETVVVLSVPDDPETRAGVKDNPVWQALPFVRQGQVRMIDDRFWPFGGPLSIRRLAGQLVEALIEGHAASQDH